MQSMQVGPTFLKLNTRVLHLLVYIVQFSAFLIAMAPHISSIALHEWLSIGLGVGIVVHLLLNWLWIVAVTKRFFGKTAWSARINYMLNTVLFIDMTVIILSGLLISEAVLPQ